MVKVKSSEEYLERFTNENEDEDVKYQGNIWA